MTLFVLSLVVAAALRPLIAALALRGLRPALAVMVVFGACLAIVVALVLLVSNALRQLRWEQAAPYRQLLCGYQGTRRQRIRHPGLCRPGNCLRSSNYIALRRARQGVAGVTSFLGATTGLLDAFSKLALILVLSIYLSIDYIRFERLWLSLVPVKQRERARAVWRALESGLGAYVRSETVQSRSGGGPAWLDLCESSACNYPVGLGQ